MEKKIPEKKFRIGTVSATIWKNQCISKKGETFDTYTISIERNYTDKENRWSATNSMRINDLPKVELVSRLAYEFVMTRNLEDEEVSEWKQK